MFSLTVSDRLLLRAYEESDVPIFYQTISNERAYLRPWISWIDRVQTKIDAFDLIQQGHQQIREQQALPLGIFDNGQLIGGIGMHGWNHELNKAKIGYWLREAEQGNGVMTESSTTFIDYLFNTVQLHKIELEYFPENLKSGKLAKRLGFSIEGIIRHASKYHGAYHDLVVCGIMKTEWENKMHS